MSVMEILRTILDYSLVINIILAFLLLFFERKHPTVTLTWILALLFMPVLGFVLYIFLGQDLRKQKIFYLKETEEQDFYNLIDYQKAGVQASYPPFDEPRLNLYHDLIMLNLNGSQSLFTRDNDITIYNDGQEHFEALMESIRKASRFIHIQYYIIRNDSLGREFMKLLTSKAQEGVEVLLLYDGMGCLRLPWKFFKPLEQAGGKTAKFFPPFIPYINLRINYRNHRKICVIDGEEAWVGGFNLGNEYRGMSRKYRYWRDTHICLKGGAVGALEFRFLLDWRFAANDDGTADPENLTRYFASCEAEGAAGVQIVSSGPDSSWPAIKHGYLKMISLAKERVYVATPYLIPDSSILEALKLAALSGVDTRVLVPGMSDHPFVRWASLYYVGDLLEAGVKCYSYEKGFVHSKTIMVDGFVSSVGTANLDIRSFKVNFEVNAFIYDNEVTRALEEAFLADLEDSREITVEAYNDRSLWVKFKEGVSRILSPVL